MGPYLIHSTLGSGGGGQVYRAEHRLLGRSVAIKVLHAENACSHEGLARFVREARVVNMIRHPAIVDIYEFGELPDARPYFVMELLEGSDVNQLINSQGRFDPQDMLQIITLVCSALDAAHSAGVVHRDLKANNVNVAIRDGRYVVKLLDFGIAKLLAPDENTAGLTQAGSRLGTATAMSPEQIRGEPVDQRTDIYALGVLIFHMLTGRYPFLAPTAQETDRMNLEAPAPRPSQSVPATPALDAVVLRCMEKIPDRRYQSAKAVLEALRAAVEGSAATQRDGAPAPGGGGVRRRAHAGEHGRRRRGAVRRRRRRARSGRADAERGGPGQPAPHRHQPAERARAVRSGRHRPRGGGPGPGQGAGPGAPDRHPTGGPPQGDGHACACTSTPPR